jgi:hypothetical protein
MSSKSKQSGTKNVKTKAKQLYTIEDLDAANRSPGHGSIEEYEEDREDEHVKQVSKRLDMDHPDVKGHNRSGNKNSRNHQVKHQTQKQQPQQLITGYRAFEYEQDEHEQQFQNLINGN